MAKPHVSSISPLSLFLLLLLLPTAAPNTPPPLESFIYGGCSSAPYTPNSPFSSNLHSLLSSLANSASSSSSYNHSSKNDVVHGLYQCRGDLSSPDCASCVAHAVSQLTATCPSSSGAVVQLQGCYVKYDAEPFLGVQDKALVFKKFGPSVGYEREKTVGPDRDAVLAGLVEEGSGPYRAVGSGSVRGVAQCVEDLSVDQCNECVDEAVKVLRSECGTAAHGDVFLGKCYARFSVAASAPGVYGKSLGVRSFAVIAGLLAGVVILIIFFTFLCRAFGGKNSSKAGK